MSERKTLPPPADGVKFTVRQTWAEPIEWEEVEQYFEPVPVLFELTSAQDVMTVEPMFTIDPEDANCPAVFLAWAHMLSMWDPFQPLQGW